LGHRGSRTIRASIIAGIADTKLASPAFVEKAPL
jgi:hypothetical protein